VLNANGPSGSGLSLVAVRYSNAAMRWSLWRGIAFRFLFIYFVLYCTFYWIPLELLWG
jgi:hypothetical protein